MKRVNRTGRDGIARGQFSNRKWATVAGVALATVSQLWSDGAARADDKYFDGDGVGTSVQAQSGVWDLAGLHWAPSPSLPAPYGPWVEGSNAIFNGPGGTISLQDVVTATGVSVTSGRYFFLGTGGKLNWDSGGTAVLNVGAGADVQAFSSIGGSGGYTKTGTGSFGFYNDSVTSGPVNVNEGTLYFASSNGNLANNTALTVAAGATFDFRGVNDTFGSLAGAGTVKGTTLSNLGIATGPRIVVGVDNSTTTFSGSIQGTGIRFDKQGTGQMTLSGANTFDGFVTVQAGKLRLEGGQSLGDTAPVFTLNAATANLELGANETMGVLGGGGATGGNVNVNGNVLTLAGPFANIFAAQFTGSGTIIKTGTGMQVLGGVTPNSSYTGKWEVQSGVLGFGADLRLGANPATVTADYLKLSGGEIYITGTAGATLGSRKGVTVTADSTVTVNGAVDSVFTVGAQGGAAITGTGALTKRGAGVLLVQGDSGASYSGNWLIRQGTLRTNRGIAAPFGSGSYDIDGGTLSLVPGSGAGAVAYTLATATPTSNLAYGPGAVLDVNRNGNTSFLATFGSPLAATPDTALVRKSRGTLVITAASGVANLGNALAGGESIVFNGGVTLANGLMRGVIGTTSFTSADPAQSAGDFLTYGATGVAAATYTSSDLATSTATDVTRQLTTTVLAGPAAAAALKVGDGIIGALVDAGGNTVTIGNNVDPGMLILNQNSSISNGKVDFRASQGVIYTQLGVNDFDAQILGSNGLSKVGPGTLRLKQAAAYTGPTDLNQGTLALTGPNQLPTTTNFTMRGNSTLDLSEGDGASQEFATFNGDALPTAAGTGGVSIAFGTNSVLKMGAGDMVYSGNATSPAGQGNATLWKAGPGVLTLGRKQSIGTFSANVASPAMSYDKLWATGGGVIEISSGNSIPDSGANGSQLPDAFLLDGGTLRINTLNTGLLTTGGASTFALSSGASAVRGLTVGTNGGTIDVTNPYEIVFFQINNAEDPGVTGDLIRGEGTLTKTGPGFFRLGLGNSFAGNWVIKGGALQFQRDRSLGSDTVPFASARVTIDGGMIQSNGSGIMGPTFGIYVGSNGARIQGPFVINGPISGPGQIERLGAQNNAHLNVTNTFSGGVKVTNGNIYFNANGAAGSGPIIMDPLFQVGFGKNEGGDSTITNPIQLNDGALIDIRVASDVSPIVESVLNGQQVGSLTLAGKISGSGRLFKGLTASETYFIPFQFTNTVIRPLDGTVVFANGTNDFTGPFTIAAGTVEVTASGALGATSGPTIVTGAGTLTFRDVNYAAAEPLHVAGNGKGGFGAVRNASGNNTFAGPVALMANTSFGIDAGSLNLTGPVTGNSQLTKTGPGKLTLSNAANQLGNVFVQSGAMDFAATQHLAGTLTVGGGNKATLTSGRHVLRTAGVDLQGGAGTLDLTDGALVVDYTDVTGSPHESIKSLIITGYNAAGVHWAGTGITSSTAQAGAGQYAVGSAEASQVLAFPGGGNASFLGESVDPTTYLVRFTLNGDATLDGTVDFNDLVRLAQNYNGPSGTDQWYNGDFNYDGVTDFNDLVPLAQNYNQSLPAAAQVAQFGAGFGEDLARAFAAVPEPGTLAGLGVVATATLFRRRRREA